MSDAYVEKKNFFYARIVPQKIFFCALQSVGFEPTHPKILRPERSALDHSAKIAPIVEIHTAVNILYDVTIVTLWSNRLIR